jgi:hypothetical protein
MRRNATAVGTRLEETEAVLLPSELSASEVCGR